MFESLLYLFSTSMFSDFRSVMLFFIIPRDDETINCSLLKVKSKEMYCWSDGTSSAQGFRAHTKSCRKSLWQSVWRTGMLARLIPEPLTHPYMWPVMECSIQGWSKVAGFTRSANLHLAGWYERKEGNIGLIMCHAKMDSLTWNLTLTFSF